MTECELADFLISYFVTNILADDADLQQRLSMGRQRLLDFLVHQRPQHHQA